MNPSEMMIPTHENSTQMIPATPPASAAVGPAVNGNVPATREQPESRHRNVETGKMYPIGFGMRTELFDRTVIAAAVYQSNGREATLERIKNAFYGQWGVELTTYESQQVSATQDLERLTTESARVADILKETPQTKTIDGLVLPTGVALWGWWGLVVLLIGLNALAITNAASYFRYQTQGWFIGVLMVAPLMFASVPVKYAAAKLSQPARRRMGWTLACLGGMAFILLVFTVAARANPLTAADISDGTAHLGTGLIPWQLASQIILEFVIAAALWHWLLESMAINSKLIINPDAEMLGAKLGALHAAMQLARDRLAFAQGNLREMQGSLNYWLQLAETIFQTYLEEKQNRDARLAAVNALYQA